MMVSLALSLIGIVIGGYGLCRTPKNEDHGNKLESMRDYGFGVATGGMILAIIFFIFD